MKRWLWLLMIGTCSMMTAQQDNPFFGTTDGESAADGSVSSDNSVGGPGSPGCADGDPNCDDVDLPADKHFILMFGIAIAMIVIMARKNQLALEKSNLS